MAPAQGWHTHKSRSVNIMFRTNNSGYSWQVQRPFNAHARIEDDVRDGSPQHWCSSMVSVYLSCDINTHTPAQKRVAQASYCTHLLLHTLYKQAWAWAWVWIAQLNIDVALLVVSCVCLFLLVLLMLLLIYIFASASISVVNVNILVHLLVWQAGPIL